MLAVQAHLPPHPGPDNNQPTQATTQPLLWLLPTSCSAAAFATPPQCLCPAPTLYLCCSPSCATLGIRPALAQQRDDKQAPDSADCSPAGLDTLGCSTLESVVQPNTATDPREGQYRMGLDPSGYEKFRCLSPSLSPQQAQGSTASQPDKFQSIQLDVVSERSKPGGQVQERVPGLSAHLDLELLRRARPCSSSSTPSSPRSFPRLAPGRCCPPPAVLETKPSTSVAVLSPSSTSSSSKASSTRVAAAAAPATRAHTTSAAAAGAKLREKKEREDIHSKISFSGGPSCLPRSIAKARKRSKQMPTWPPLTQQTPAALTTTETVTVSLLPPEAPTLVVVVVAADKWAMLSSGLIAKLR
ncbi:hypothetical protein PTTG_01112 [Puccinia triticina 1-1 BBBD Race 1]|uniref:Uncharacterized protein n=1 Tax=Puccinia triticina (isolate 1-1 / race 1 (BBBD)) TaxID=630390 RepID=A0A180GZP1_PUCT1|nr:hypothetical protein PTTG_01112 [Puccinia triticina 1-1 BBBD Race 1]